LIFGYLALCPWKTEFPLHPHQAFPEVSWISCFLKSEIGHTFG